MTCTGARAELRVLVSTVETHCFETRAFGFVILFAVRVRVGKQHVNKRSVFVYVGIGNT